MPFDERAFRLVWRDRPARQLYNAIAILERDIVRARNMHLPELRDLERQKDIVATILEQRLRPPRNMGGSIGKHTKKTLGLGSIGKYAKNSWTRFIGAFIKSHRGMKPQTAMKEGAKKWNASK
jgi:hypothetical protein